VGRGRGGGANAGTGGAREREPLYPEPASPMRYGAPCAYSFHVKANCTVSQVAHLTQWSAPEAVKGDEWVGMGDAHS